MNNIITQEEKNRIDALCKYYSISYYTINQDGTIDTQVSVDLSALKLNQLPLKFNKVEGYFDCSTNTLTTLEGSPTKVSGGFYCYKNLLKSLIHSPSQVGGNFMCDNNILTSLEHCPSEINFGFYCGSNQLTSLEYCPKKVGDFMDCISNQITSLEHFPKEVGNISGIRNNKLPMEFYDLYEKLSETHAQTFIKLMNYYDVWTPEFSEENMQLLIGDINDGLL